MSHTNGYISSPVYLDGDVNAVLTGGIMPSPTLQIMGYSSAVNSFARFKPENIQSTGSLTISQRYTNNFGFGSTGIREVSSDLGIYSGSNYYLQCPWTTTNTSDGCYRLSDFDGYWHTAWSSSISANKGFALIGGTFFLYTGSGQLGWNLEQNTTSTYPISTPQKLMTDELRVYGSGSSLSSYTLNNYYPGVIAIDTTYSIEHVYIFNRTLGSITNLGTVVSTYPPGTYTSRNWKFIPIYYRMNSTWTIQPGQWYNVTNITNKLAYTIPAEGYNKSVANSYISHRWV